MSNKRVGLEKFLDVAGAIVAIITMLAYVVFIIDANWAFLPGGIVYTIVAAIRTYGLIALLVVTALEATAKANIIIRIVIYVLLATIVIFQFFPGTWDTVVGTINR